MNKFLTKIVGAALGLTLAIGVGVAVGVNHGDSREVDAVNGDNHDFAQTTQQLLNNNASIASISIAQQSYPIKEIIVSYRYNNTITDAVTMTVMVGSTNWGSFNVNGTGSNYSTESFTHEAQTGAVTISFVNNTGGGTKHGTFYVNNVRLVEGSASSAPAVSLSETSITGYSTESFSVTANYENFDGELSWKTSGTGSIIRTENETGATYSGTLGNAGTVTLTAYDSANEDTVNASCTFTINEFTPSVYTKVINAPSDWTGRYALVYETGGLAFDASLDTLDASSNTKSVTIVSNSFTTTVANHVVYFDIESVTGGFAIKSQSGYYIGQGGDSNGMSTNKSTKYVNTISLTNNGTIDIVGSGGAHLRYNSDSGQERFRYYRSSSYTAQKAICLYRLDNVKTWIDSKMHMTDYDSTLSGNGDGSCAGNSGYYALAKAAFLELPEVDRVAFQNNAHSKYTNALARYNAWAEICKDNTPFAAGLNANILINNNKSSSSTLVIILIASISLVAVSGYFVIRRRREN